MLGSREGLTFIDPDDKEYSDILKSARRKMERPMAPAMPCKRDGQLSGITKVVQSNGSEEEFKTICGCMVESHESARQRANSTQSKIHEDRVAGEGFTSMTQSRCHKR